MPERCSFNQGSICGRLARRVTLHLFRAAIEFLCPLKRGPWREQRREKWHFPALADDRREVLKRSKRVTGCVLSALDWHYRHSFRSLLPSMRPILKSSKLANVCYDIRGP